MIEIPEARNLAKQCEAVLRNKQIEEVVAYQSPHKFAWYVGRPEDYASKLKGKTIQSACAAAGFLEIKLENLTLAFSDGTQLRYLEAGKAIPNKHQLLIRFSDQSHLLASIRMYGGIWCFRDEEWKNKDYAAAKEKPSPISASFTQSYFFEMMANEKNEKTSVKAFLATKQRIPGLGNGILQDILYEAGVHPKRKINTLTVGEREALYRSIRSVIQKMVECGGRDTEKDLHGNYGGYQTKMSRRTLGAPCPKCKTPITKEAYLGGSIYVCSQCQRI